MMDENELDEVASKKAPSQFKQEFLIVSVLALVSFVLFLLSSHLFNLNLSVWFCVKMTVASMVLTEISLRLTKK